MVFRGGILGRMLPFSVMWSPMPPCLTPQWQSCLWIRKRPLIEWIGLLCMPLSVEWGLALPFFSGSTCFILAFKVPLMSMVISPFFSLSRGVRQGCPLSPLLYVLVAEVLACNNRANPRIKGLCLTGQSDAISPISQYADDTSLVVCSDAAIRACFNVYDVYERGSGSRLNLSKSKGLWLGPALGPIVLTCRLALTRRQLKLRFLGFSWAPGT